MRWLPHSPFDTPLLDSPLLLTRLGCVAVVCLLCLGISLRVRNLDIPTGRSPDEANYTAQAQRLLREGGAGLRGIADDYMRDPAARLAGPPTRAGYLWALAATMHFTGHHDEMAGAVLSSAASIASLLLVALIGIRFFPPWATLYALLFFSIFPPELELARRAWSDALVGLLGLAVAYCAMEITLDSSRRFWLAAFLATGCLGTVVKEFGAVTFALCAAWVVGLLLWRGQRRDALLTTVAGLAGALACLLWLARGVGGLIALIQVVHNWRGAHVANQYAMEFQSGPPSYLLRALWVMSPGLGILLVFAPIAVFSVISSARHHLFPPAVQLELRAIQGLALFSLIYLSIPLLLPNWLNLRYVSVLFGPLMLLSGLGWALASALLLEKSSPRWSWLLKCVMVMLLIILVANDYRRFSKYFINQGVGDLSVKLILDRADLSTAERLAKRRPTPENYLDLCRRYEQNWRYVDSIAACANALKLRPDYAEAHDQMAVAHIELQQWKEAAAAAQQALALNASLPRSQTSLQRAQRELAAAKASP